MSRTDHSALTAAQRDIWVAHERFPLSPQYNAFLSKRFVGPVDLDALRVCVNDVLARNDAFRLRFGEQDGVPYQWAADEPPTARLLDLSSSADPAAACRDWIAADFDRPLDVRAGVVEAVLLVEGPAVAHVYVKVHHIVADAFGLGLCFEQLEAGYACRVANGAPPAAPPSFLDSVAEDAGYRASARHAEDREYFRTVLADTVPALFERPAASGSRRTARYSFTVPREALDVVKQRGESPFAVLAAAFATYLCRVHRSDEVVLGVPLLNRRGAHLRTVGHFVNTLPLRVCTADAATPAELAGQVRAASRELQRRERLAIGDLLRDRPVGVSRELFDVTLSYVQWPAAHSVAGLRTETRGGTRAHDSDVVAVVVNEFGDTGEVRVDLDYALDVFDEDFPVDALARHVRNLMTGAARAPHLPMRELSQMDDDELRAVVHGRNATEAAFPDAATLHGLFEDQVARTPDRVALVSGDGTEPLTFAQLDTEANRLAHALRADGVGPDDLVGILLERGPLLLVAIMAVLKAGGAYVPVDPGNPAERIGFVLRDSGAKVVLTSSDLPAPPETTARVRHVDIRCDEPGTPLPPLATACNLAYVIYTSGSTGRPKGVLVEHRSVVNRLHWMQRRYPIGVDDALLQKTPTSFDVSVWELFWWSFTGARLGLLPPGAERDPDAILDVLERERVTVVHFVPSLFGPFLEAVAVRGRPESLRRVFASGEALPPAQVSRFHELFGGAAQLVNLYGPTETTVDVSFFECPAAPVRRVPIGRPIDNIRLYVLGRDDLPQPVGVPGELHVAGVGVARGYLGRDELTKERFVADPFVPDARMYRTGDLARLLADGEIEYLGRVDEQVKVRGNRVEPAEVAHRLAELPGVREAVVVDRRSPERGVYLVGYYAAPVAIDPARVRDHLAATLPDYMIPARFARIDRIPLTPNGKTDRRALPEVDWEAGGTGPTPRTDEEKVLAEVWAEVLGVGEVGVHDDYYALGGDSILMLRVRAEAARRGVTLALADLVAHPTIAALAPFANRAEATALPDEIAPFALVSDVDRTRLTGAQDAYPVTPMQLGVLFHSREHEGSAVYRDVFRYTFAFDWDEAALRWAFDRLVRRHPVLRTSYDLAGFSEPLQVVHPTVDNALSVADLRALPDEAAEAAVRDHIEQRRLQDYDFHEAPLYHFRVLVRPSTVDVVFSFHHVILDGWSASTLIAELCQDYLCGLGAEIAPVPDGEVPSPAWHVLEERRAVRDERARQFWLEALDGATLLQLDPYVPHEPPRRTRTSVRWFDLPEGTEEQVRRFAAEHGVPARSVYLAAHCLMLRLLSGAQDVTTGLFTHGRPEVPHAERTTGLFLNTMPVRLAGEQDSWLDVVSEVVRQERAAYPYRRYPLSAIQDDRGGDTVLETGFNYVNLHVLEPVLAAPEIELLDVQAFEETNFALLVHLIVSPVDGRMRLRLDSSGRIFSPSQVDLLARTFLSILSQIVEAPGNAPDLSVLAPPPRFVPPAEVPPRHAVSRLAEQIELVPDAIAVASGEQRWTYRRLGEAVDRIAGRLLALGADNTRCIGIVMDRSPEMVAVVMGILKTGAACVPLDVSYPRERLSLMIEVAGPLLVIAHSRHAGLIDDPNLVRPIESFADEPADAPARWPEVSLEDTACILFTSGSTGRPKGVELPHRPFAYYLEWQTSPAGAASSALGGKTLQFAPLSFDVSFQEIFSTLSGGGTLQMITPEHRGDPAALARLMDRERVERIFVPYVGLQQLAEASQTLDIRPRALRVIISSGEQLRVTDEIRWLCAQLPGTVLENQYGPTETHLVTRFTMTGDPAQFPALPPIGPPVDYLEVHVLDTRMRPVPEGVAGEVYVGGIGLAHGYRGQPEITDRAFVPHPWRPGERLYRVGDLARALPGGDLVYLGRADNQVKVRGFRVEPAEVEFAILAFAAEHPGIREAAVVARRRDGGDAFLAAFLVGDRAAVELGEARAWLRATLPEYMVPSYFTWLPALPMTPSGKRDDAALRAMPLAAQTAAEVTPPRDERERALADIVSGLLGLPAIGVHDDFFVAGGTSLTAMRLIVMIEKFFGVPLPLATFVSAPTVAELAKRLRDGAVPRAFDPLVAIRAGGGTPPLYLVHPLGGNVLCYVRLARHLPGDQPVYALQAAGSAPGTTPLNTMADLARSYLDAVRRVQPEGPYTIAGWSFGGFVAFEMARLLRAAGETVEHLVVIDAISPEPAEKRPPDPSSDSLLEWFYWELLWADAGASARVEPIPAQLSRDEKFDLVADRAAAAGILPPAAARVTVRRLFDVYQANWAALVAYRPEVAEFDLTLLRAEESMPAVLLPMHGRRTAYQDPANGWGGFTTGKVDVVPVPGDHLTLMDEPNVRVVAEAITAVTGVRRNPHTASEGAAT